tara:strand:+ start:238 stop:729 length:492 start_codon:yes stop_codon:yes gene_type:complete
MKYIDTYVILIKFPYLDKDYFLPYSSLSLTNCLKVIKPKDYFKALELYNRHFDNNMCHALADTIYERLFILVDQQAITKQVSLMILSFISKVKSNKPIDKLDAYKLLSQLDSVECANFVGLIQALSMLKYRNKHDNDNLETILQQISTFDKTLSRNIMIHYNK